MKRALSILLIITFIFQSTSKLWILGVFYANRDYIAKNLCINRNNEQSKCKGSCQLKKQLEKDSEQQSKSNLEKNAKEVLVFHQSIPYSVIGNQIFPIQSEQKFSTFYSQFFPQGHTHAVFHPPAAMV